MSSTPRVPGGGDNGKKDHTPAVVEQSPIKKPRLGSILKALKQVEARSFMSNDQEITITTVKGGIFDVIKVDQGATEGFVNHVTQLLFKFDKEELKSEDKVKRQQLINATRIICQVPRRHSRMKNDVMYKPPTGKTIEDNKYKMSYFVRYNPGVEHGKDPKLLPLQALKTVRTILS